jgi:hypothetical protein
MNFGSDLQYQSYYVDIQQGGGNITTSDGRFYMTSSGTWVQPDYSSGSEVWKDVPVRVVIMDDKPYTAP